jgi:hypothetical protein
MDKLDKEEYERQIKDNDRRVKNFSEIVGKMNELPEEKKTLYKEIYENAITDRQHSYGMYRILLTICDTNSTEHAVHARSIATFIEKMSRANDQIIKLADLLRRAEEREQEIDPEDMFKAIQKK